MRSMSDDFADRLARFRAARERRVADALAYANRRTGLFGAARRSRCRYYDDTVTEIRTLAEDAVDEMANVQPRRCWGLHRWTMWQPFRSADYWQRRRCLRCGLVKDRKV